MRWRASLLALVGVTTGVAAAGERAPATAPAISSPAGAVVGRSAKGVDAFLGIPFAAPPVGALRWAAPRPAKPWSGLRQATRMAPGCLQTLTPDGIPPWTSEYMAPAPVAEDCLYLNVWTPAHARHQHLPVMVWIHGGAFQAGSNAVPIYDGAALARQNIIVVAINYRLGAFGFLDTPAMHGIKGAGNFGLMDAIAALRWVHDNIASFGGDPAKVTIAGQSAGAMMVNNLLTAPAARGLFRAAIMESETVSTIPPLATKQTLAAGATFEDTVGAHDMHALRALPAATILAASDALRARIKLRPTLDPQVLPEPPVAALQAGRRAAVPILSGINSGEPYVAPTAAAAMQQETRERYGPDAAMFLSHYPAGSDAEASASARRSANDALRANMLRWARLRVSRLKAPLFLYYFDHSEPGPESARFGAFHSSEIPYVFGTLHRSPGRAFTARDRAIAGRMQQYWAQFIKTGSPNAAGLPHWAPARSPSWTVMELGDRWGAIAPLAAPLPSLFDRAAR